MTITNHIRDIQDHAASVIEHVDARRYRMAHNALYIIETKARLAHEHIDNLQYVTPKTQVPAGGS